MIPLFFACAALMGWHSSLFGEVCLRTAVPVIPPHVPTTLDGGFHDFWALTVSRSSLRQHHPRLKASHAARPLRRRGEGSVDEQHFFATGTTIENSPKHLTLTLPQCRDTFRTASSPHPHYVPNSGSINASWKSQPFLHGRSLGSTRPPNFASSSLRGYPTLYACRHRWHRGSRRERIRGTKR